MKRVENIPELSKIDQLYPPLYFGIENTSAVIFRDHKYPQELTTQIFSYVASHMRIILPPKRC